MPENFSRRSLTDRICTSNETKQWCISHVTDVGPEVTHRCSGHRQRLSYWIGILTFKLCSAVGESGKYIDRVLLWKTRYEGYKVELPRSQVVLVSLQSWVSRAGTYYSAFWTIINCPPVLDTPAAGPSGRVEKYCSDGSGSEKQSLLLGMLLSELYSCHLVWWRWFMGLNCNVERWYEGVAGKEQLAD